MLRVLTSDINPQEHIFYPNTGTTEASQCVKNDEITSFTLKYHLELRETIEYNGSLKMGTDEPSGNLKVNMDKQTYNSSHVYSEEELIAKINPDDYIVDLPPVNSYKIKIRVKSIEKGLPCILNPEDL